MRLLLAGTVTTLTAAALAAIQPAVLTREEVDAAGAIRASRLRADVRFLSDDLLEGRSPGTRGEALARAYVRSRLEAAGLEPGAPGGGWEQPVEMVSVSAECPREASVRRGGETVALGFPAEYVAWSGVPRETVRVDDAELVFVGFGIVAPEYRWDDFKGASLAGKVLVFLNDEPSSDPASFEGRRRLYYGRWDYKLERAARLGAAGAIIIHTDASAGYRWQVVQSSWTGEQFALPQGPDEPQLPLRAWVTEAAARRICALAGRDLDALRAAAESREFRPLPLGVTLSLALRNTLSRRTSANVIARLPGSDPALAGEAVLYTAHHDHLGTRPGASGETLVYNGALDNASGVAALLAVAEAFAALPQRPRRTLLFASVTGEEQGLLGSEALARRPPVPAGRIAACLNLDGVNVWGRTRDVPVIGLGRSTLDEWVRAVAAAQGRTVVPESFPEKGAFYRSDHFSFARAGVPSLSVDAGTEVVGRPPGWARGRQEAWEAAHYHQPSDDLTEEWDLSGAVEDVKLLFHLGAKVADAPRPPQWREGDEFEPARARALSAAEGP